ncbi:MAG: ankyrin repeat domain-containing protein [Pseudobdellovibrio sp.]
MENEDFFEACELGDIETVKKLLKLNPEFVHARDQYKFTPLHLAAGDVLEIAKILLANGADLHAVDDDGSTPLHCALYPEMTDFLISKGAKLNALDNNGDTPLIGLASEDEGYESMEVLLEAGASPSIKNKNGETALDIARGRGEEDKIEMLLEFLNS